MLVKKLKNPARVLLDVKQARLHAQQEKTQTIHDPHGIVTTIHTAAVVDDGTPGVKIMAHVRTPVPFEVKQDKNTVRLALGQTADSQCGPAVLPRTMPVPKHTGDPANSSDDVPSPVAGPVVLTASCRIVAQATPRSWRCPGRGTSPTSAASRPGRSAAGNDFRPQRPCLRCTSGPITVTETPVYSGQKISLDFQDADINDILRLIAEVSGLNIIAGGDVQGKVTTRMVDVPWDQALDIVLKINGLDQEREGNIIRVAPLERFNTERQERLKAPKSKSKQSRP